MQRLPPATNLPPREEPALTPNPRRAAFTLVELLASIAVLGLLSGLLMAGLSSARQAAENTTVLSGARSLIQAYLAAPQENRGRYLMGYGSPGKTLNPPGHPPISAPQEDAKRYPWRIAPFLEDGVESLYLGSHREFYEENAAGNTYNSSLYPTFGINSIFVGGHYDGRKHSPGYRPGGRSRDTSTFPPSFWVLRPGDAHSPSNLIVFATALARSPDFPDPVGFYRVLPPNSPLTPAWGSYNREIPANLGHVSLEYGDKAIIAHLDGSVTTLTEEELRDMRRWSNQAAMADDPDFSNWTSE